MTNNIEIFKNEEFGNVRTIEVEGKILFCASDVAKALGYVNSNKAVNDHCRAITKWSTPISGKMQDINFIPEGDVYRLIVRSKLPSAEKFESWLFDEVVPTIRKTGGYVNDSDLFVDSWFNDLDPEFKDILKVSFKKIKDLKEENNALSEKNDVLSFTNKCLTKETLTWDKRKVVVAMIRSLAHRVYNNDYKKAYSDFYKELRYKKSICLS